MLQRDDNLRQYATDRQWELLEAYWDHGSDRAAAQALGVNHTLPHQARHRVYIKAARAGYSPEHDHFRPAPPGYQLRGASTLYDGDGNLRLQWIKTKIDPAEQEAILAAIAAEFAADLHRAEPVERSELSDPVNFLAAYPIGDHHLGMYSWHEETGQNYDLKLGERLLTRGIDYLVGTTPSCRQAAVVFLGDFMHYDSLIPVTPTSKNHLDSDGRFAELVRVAIRAMRYAIRAALEKHEHVHLIVEPGNHDLVSTVFLQECMANVYENEPRLSVDTSPRHFHYLEFGKNLIGVHHGHSVKLPDLPLIMAADQPEAWGRTEHRYWWTGHIHNRHVMDVGGVQVESFRVMPPTDAWSANKGYRPKRGMDAILLHREYGEVSRHSVNPDMLR